MTHGLTGVNFDADENVVELKARARKRRKNLSMCAPRLWKKKMTIPIVYYIVVCIMFNGMIIISYEVVHRTVTINRSTVHEGHARERNHSTSEDMLCCHLQTVVIAFKDTFVIICSHERTTKGGYQ